MIIGIFLGIPSLLGLIEISFLIRVRIVCLFNFVLKLILKMFQELMVNLGTYRHEALIEKCYNYEVSGCFCMTEMSHGSNTRELKTTATYDPKTEVNFPVLVELTLFFYFQIKTKQKTKEFVINTPTIEDTKIWVGNLGKHCTHAAVYAQLYTPDGQCHGRQHANNS